MTTPRDDIAGLIERLRISLASVEPDDFRGDNLAIFIASELEPLIEDETLDDSGTWKQGALDACDRVLDAIHAHYATQLDALSARVKELEAEQNDVKRADAGMDLWRARALRAEQERDRIQSELDTSNDNHRAMAAQLARTGQERDEALAALKPLSRLEVPKRPQGNAGVYSIRHSDIEAARDLVRQLASGPTSNPMETTNG